MKNIIYLDNAATTYPKPSAVYKSVRECMEKRCGNAGRGVHPLAVAAAEEIYACRLKLSNFFGASSPENVIFTLNTTHAINTAIKSLICDGDHVLISELEHNSVYRPISKLAAEGKISYDIFKVYPEAEYMNEDKIIENIDILVSKKTRMLICTHASNICSVTLPISKIGKYCRERGILFVVDAAQSAGLLSINMARDNIDALCLPAHKGLYGPQGVGVLILRDGLKCDTLIEGGNGVDSLSYIMSDELPERLEAGTLPTQCIAGLSAGIDFINSVGMEKILLHEEKLCRKAKLALATMPNIKLYAPATIGSVIMFSHRNIKSDVISAELSKKGICTRSGYHCTALGHRALCTPEGGGVRISFGYFNKSGDVDILVKALCEIL